jgi:hypothetical protein
MELLNMAARIMTAIGVSAVGMVVAGIATGTGLLGFVGNFDLGSTAIIHIHPVVEHPVK